MAFVSKCRSFSQAFVSGKEQRGCTCSQGSWGFWARGRYVAPTPAQMMCFLSLFLTGTLACEWGQDGEAGSDPGDTCC